eukprot:TRINITY_DN26290_c0_g1_i1.p1 TRINITY_DN26290_c0_g1~~TRINITY_DN26290_c0_g1_i1.p1  ORF type:complete len:314 (+),score=61.92 TRINITY_DN26290_c0_g1_i1:520-1461(+)
MIGGMLMRSCQEFIINLLGNIRLDTAQSIPLGCAASVATRTSWFPHFLDEPQIYGAAFFCTNAAMRKLLPHLASSMTLLPARLYLPIYRDHLPPADIIMNACIEDLEIEKAGLPFHGDGTPWSRSSQDGSPLESAGDVNDSGTAEAGQEAERWQDARNLVGRPALWHMVKTEADFEALHFFHTRFGDGFAGTSAAAYVLPKTSTTPPPWLRARSCGPPAKPRFVAGGRECPRGGPSCLNNNLPYASFYEAWHRCAQHPECGIIMQYDHGKDSPAMWHLRRHADPACDEVRKDKCVRSTVFSCSDDQEESAVAS